MGGEVETLCLNVTRWERRENGDYLFSFSVRPAGTTTMSGGSGRGLLTKALGYWIPQDVEFRDH